MQNKLELSLLIDYYGAFLTDNQCEMLKLNCEEDFSLAEIRQVQVGQQSGSRLDPAPETGQKLRYPGFFLIQCLHTPNTV